MTTATKTAAPLTAPCRISYDVGNFSWVKIENTNTGRSMTLSMAGRQPNEFQGHEGDLWRLLGNTPTGAIVTLNAFQMNHFKRMCSRNKLDAAPSVNPLTADEMKRRVKVGALYHLDYDIHSKKYSMDYPTLYRLAIQTSESCYYFEGSRVPWKMIDDMNKSGCTCNLVRTHDDEIQGLLARAEVMIAKKMQEKEASMQQSIEDGLTDLETDLNDPTKSPEKARKRYDNRIKSAIRSANKLAEYFAEQAKNYGLRINLSGLRAASNGLMEQAKAKAAAYSKAASQVKGPLAAVANTMPAEVLMDALRDEGNDEAADQLQSEFYDLETNETV